jgi:hypothetical protein
MEILKVAPHELLGLGRFAFLLLLVLFLVILFWQIRRDAGA